MVNRVREAHREVLTLVLHLLHLLWSAEGKAAVEEAERFDDISVVGFFCFIVHAFGLLFGFRMDEVHDDEDGRTLHFAEHSLPINIIYHTLALPSMNLLLQSPIHFIEPSPCGSWAYITGHPSRPRDGISYSKRKNLKNAVDGLFV
jgi:hypothetical protein